MKLRLPCLGALVCALLSALPIAAQTGVTVIGTTGNTIGTVDKGKEADLVVVKGDLRTRIQAVEDVETVYKRGVAYDPAALIDSVRGSVGLY